MHTEVEVSTRAYQYGWLPAGIQCLLDGTDIGLVVHTSLRSGSQPRFNQVRHLAGAAGQKNEAGCMGASDAHSARAKSATTTEEDALRVRQWPVRQVLGSTF